MSLNAYPLSWPSNWKRTGEAYRTAARFGKAGGRSGERWIPARALTVQEALSRVLTELERMGIERDDIVVSTNVPTRMDGMPRSGAAEPRDPGVAVYWEERAGARRVMAIDRYDRVADNLAAVAATLDAMRSIERHGGAMVLERAFTGFTALPAPIVAGMKRDWSIVLGLAKLLAPTANDVRQAYRRLAAKHHPDRGGNPAAMAELNQARDEALQEIAS